LGPKGSVSIFLPTYSLYLKIAETLWPKLKSKWIGPEEYFEKDSLFYAVNRCLANVGTDLKLILALLTQTNFRSLLNTKTFELKFEKRNEIDIKINEVFGNLLKLLTLQII